MGKRVLPTAVAVSSGAPKAVKAAARPVIGPMLQIGTIVEAHDRHNFGTVVDIAHDEFYVRFVNPDTKATAVVSFANYELTAVR